MKNMKNPKSLTLAPTIKAGHVQTKESFLYGRFETMVKPAYGSGVVSSFFTFYDGYDFPNNWNEIDWEFLGRNTNSVDLNVIRTLNYYTDKNVNVTKHTLSKRSEDVFWKLCIDWMPGRVIWKLNDIVIRTLAVDLNRPQKLMMNIWVGDPLWAGEFNYGLAPQVSTYSYVRVSKYVNGSFVFAWQDSFEKLDLEKWYIATHNQGLVNFSTDNVSVRDSRLNLKLTVG